MKSDLDWLWVLLPCITFVTFAILGMLFIISIIVYDILSGYWTSSVFINYFLK